jgi:WD40 repeat protein
VAILQSQLEIEVFEFRPDDTSLIIAGCSNGQLALFSLKKLQSFNRRYSSILKSMKDNNEIVYINHFLTSSILESISVPQNINNTEIFSRKQVYLNSHRGEVRAIRFLPKNLELDRKNAKNLVRLEEDPDRPRNQFMTLGADGQILFWDLRFDNFRDKKNEDKSIEGTQILFILNF